MPMPPIDPTANVLLLVAASDKRQDDLREAEARHIRELIDKESRRLDAIRLVDQANVDKAADRVLAAVQTLAATTKTDAENLRTLVATTATVTAAQLEATVKRFDDRIGALEKSSYTGQGRGGGVQALYIWIIGALGAIGTMFGIYRALH